VVPLEEIQEGGLRAGGSLDAAEAEGLQAKLDLLQVQEEVLDPEGGPFPDGGGLGWLEVGVGQGGQRPVLPGEGREGLHAPDDPVPYEGQRLPVLDEIRVVPDEGAGGPQMDDPPCRRRHFPEEVDVGHDVMAEPRLELGGPLQVQVVQPRTHLLERLV